MLRISQVNTFTLHLACGAQSSQLPVKRGTPPAASTATHYTKILLLSSSSTELADENMR